MADERQLARGGIERIGSRRERVRSSRSASSAATLVIDVPDHAAAVRSMPRAADRSRSTVASPRPTKSRRLASRRCTAAGSAACTRVTAEVLAAMEEMAQVAPAHNPPYIAAMRQLNEKLPEIPLVAAFETGFHQTIPPRLANYAVPPEWAESFGVRRWGFHGASHRYIAETHGRAARAQRPAGHLLPLGRVEQRVRDSQRPERGHLDGHESRRPACRRTIASAISIRSPCQW